MTMKEEPLTPEDEKNIGIRKPVPPPGAQTFESAVAKIEDEKAKAETAEDSAFETNPNEFGPLPDWALPLPANVTLPEGRQIYVMRFRAKMTETPKLGDRYCILWSLTEADEKIAYRRTRGEAAMAMNELSKQMVRVLGFIRKNGDGKEFAEGGVPDWTDATALSITRFWNAIGAKCRAQVKNAYAKLHTMEVAEIVDFFTKCVAVRTVSG